MKTKINWFKEVLELEPGSKVFFPLAQLYLEGDRLEEAEEVLFQGLARNPEHLEARFLLVEVLSRQNERFRAADEVAAIVNILARYPGFWNVWALEGGEENKDVALAVAFLTAHFKGQQISWSEVMREGISAFTDGAVSEGLAGKAVKAGGRQAQVFDFEALEENLRTRTMAELLAEQGDFQGALDIYEELLSRENPDNSEDLEALVALMRAKCGVDYSDFKDEEKRESSSLPGPMPGKEKLLKTLEALANRLEARSAL